MKKKYWVTNLLIIIVIGIIILISFLVQKPNNQSNEELVKCIGQNSILYTQLGCHACQIQEEMFGENYEYLNVIDCFEDFEKCQGIKATPTWVINNKEYLGVQSIEKLKKLTGC